MEGELGFWGRKHGQKRIKGYYLIADDVLLKNLNCWCMYWEELVVEK